jgi:hypothetical protein
MHLRRPASPRLHPLGSPRGRLRAAQRLAGGVRPAALARIERVAEAEVDALLARPDFQRLLSALEALEAAPGEDRLRRLEGLAFFVLEHALAEGDWRYAAFVLTERRLGRNPAQTLARRAVARQRRAAKPPPPDAPRAAATVAAARSPRPGASSPCDDPAARVVARAGARLRDAVVEEHAARPAAEAATDAPRPRRLDGLAARLRSGAAVLAAEPQTAPAKGLLRAWAQGP